MTEVNIPLLRKAVEWAEAEAAKPPELREWEQRWWVSPPENRKMLDVDKAPECGTCYCIAGFITSVAIRDGEVIDAEGENVFLADGEREWISEYATAQLGLDEAVADNGDWLFSPFNTIADVRRIAESIAGESL